MTKKSLKLLFLTAFILLSTAQFVHAALTMVAGSSGTSFAPRGQKIRMLTIKLKATNGDATFSAIDIKNDATAVFFGDGIQSVSIFKQSGSGAFDPEATPLVTSTFSGTVREDFTISLSDTIPSGNTNTYFIAYEISSDADLTTTESSDTPTTTDLTIVDIRDDNGSSVSLVAPVTQTTTITGFKRVVSRAIAPNVVLPGQDGIAMLAIGLKAIGETVAGSITFTIKNKFANYAVTGAETGISNIYLVNDPDGAGAATGGTVDSASIQAIIATGEKLNATAVFNSTSEATFTFSSDLLRFPIATSSNFILVYDIGENLPVTATTQIEAQLTDLRGLGDSSKLFIIANANTLASYTTATPLVAGLGFSDLSKIPVSGAFGSGTTLPILAFNLKSFQTTINISEISIRNPQDSSDASTTIPFITSPIAVDGITKIQIFEDTNTNDTFDGVTSSDTLIGSLNLGSTNQSSLAAIPITSGSNNFLTLTKFDSTQSSYPRNNSKKFFVIYTIGNLSPGRETVTSQLSDTTGFAFIDEVSTQSISLTGTLPATANPEATVTVTNTNVVISSINSITPSPSVVIQGRQKVPMLAFRLRASQTFASASITLKNESQTFFSNSKGVTKIWLYRDNAPVGIFDDNDTFISSNDKLVLTTEANLNNIPLDTGDNDFIALYDIGQLTTVDSDPTVPSIRAQLSAMSGTSTTGASLILGGEIPSPQSPSGVAIAPKTTTITITDNTFSTATATFSITYRVTNTSSNALQVLNLKPRFFQTNISGQDISSQFDYILISPSSTSLNIAAGQSANFIFDVKYARPQTAGSAFVDAFLEYRVAKGTNETREATAILSRHRDETNSNSWLQAVTNSLLISANEVDDTYLWTVPDYIDSMSSTFGSTTKAFFNQNALTENSSLSITFRNAGENIDPSTLVIKLNGTTLLQNENGSSSSPTYDYDETLGTLTISTVGSRDGTLEINAKDLDGVALNTATITFLIATSSDIGRLTEPLFSPNPARLSNILYLGFNLTKPATVKLYVYNHLGSRIFTGEKTFTSAGYKLLASADSPSVVEDDLTLLGNLKSLLSSGFYVCKIISTDTNGNVVKIATRLAVY